MKNRRLKLLPEVLPPPNAPASSSPRTRTTERLAALMAIAAASACSREDPVSIRPEDPSKIKPKPNTNPDPTTTTTTTASATPTVTPTSVPTPPSYMVVDPLPPPAMCAGLAATIKATAAWKTGATGSFLELKLDKPGMSGAKYGKTPTTTPVYGGKLLSIAPAGDGVVVQVVPDAGSKFIYVYISAACPSGTERVYAEMSFTGTGSAVKVTLSDVY
jgi:hypothetical protein